MKIPKLQRWEAVYVEWIDSGRSAYEWGKLSKRSRRIDGCQSVGMVEYQSSDRVTLVLNRDDTNGDVCMSITIPIVAITSLRRLS